MISEIVKKVPIKKSDRFIDLGSGVGQVVLQVAAEAQCTDCTGIEKQDNPAEYARDMTNVYETMMSWYGKKHGPYEIFHGDFLDEQFTEKIANADVIFVNNFAFDPPLNQALKERFADCKEGARIVSSLNFSPMSFTITERTLSDIGCILSIRQFTSTEGVSWCPKPFDYYVHTVDRSMLSAFFQDPQRKPVTVSVMPEPEPEPEPEPVPETTKAVPKPKPKPKPRAEKEGDTVLATVPKRRSTAESSIGKRPGTDLEDAAPVKRAKAAISTSVVVSSLEQYMDSASSRVDALVRVHRNNPEAIATELKMKLHNVDMVNKDLSKESAEAVRASGDQEKAVKRELESRFDAVRARCRVDSAPGKRQLRRGKDSASVGQQVRLAVDVATDHELWLRKRALLARDVDRLKAQEARFGNLQTCAPMADSLMKLASFLGVSKDIHLEGALDASAAGARVLRGKLLRARRMAGGVHHSTPHPETPAAHASPGEQNAPTPAQLEGYWISRYFSEAPPAQSPAPEFHPGPSTGLFYDAPTASSIGKMQPPALPAPQQLDRTRHPSASSPYESDSSRPVHGARAGDPRLKPAATVSSGRPGVERPGMERPRADRPGTFVPSHSYDKGPHYRGGQSGARSPPRQREQTFKKD